MPKRLTELSMRGDAMRTHGVTEFAAAAAGFDDLRENIQRKGWHVLPEIFDKQAVSSAKAALMEIYEKQSEESRSHSVPLEKIFDENVVRMPFSCDPQFYKFIFHNRIMDCVERLLGKNFILMLQNAPLNLPTIAHQGFSWHRDLVWQHYTSDRPMAVTVTVNLDDYTLDNGGMESIEGSHLFSEFPSERFAADNIKKILAPAGSVIIFDSMLFHRAGYNASKETRNLLVMVFTLPHIKQQICIPTMLRNNSDHRELDAKELKILGFGYEAATSVLEWRLRRAKLL
jgi:ectoine hydroxylase-related dioxygenase (phytanoyl-CoA dioxygenase family)